MNSWLDLLPLGPQTLTLIYWGCLLFGLLMAMISFFFGEVLGFGLDAAEAGPVSGPMIAIFLVLFGLGGMACRELLGVTGGGSIFVALAFSLIVSAGIYYGGFRLIMTQQGGTDYDPYKVRDVAAKVITSIPVSGTGEIAFDTNSGRISGPAQTSDGSAVPGGSVVNIDRYAAGVYMVSRFAATPAATHTPGREPDNPSKENAPA